MSLNSNKTLSFSPKKNDEKTEKEPLVNYDFKEFAKKEQKKQIEKNFKEILKNHPEIYKIILENEKLEKQSNEFLEENILLGEKIDGLEIIIKNYKSKDIDRLISENQNLKNDNYNLKKILEEIKLNFENKIKSFENEISKIKKENTYLKNENDKKRKLGGFVKDKFMLSLYKAELNEYKEKWESVGRKKLPTTVIKEIILLHKNSKWSYGEIAKHLKISKTSVYKYLNLYEQGKLKDLINLE